MTNYMTAALGIFMMHELHTYLLAAVLFLAIVRVVYMVLGR